ncbi:MAG TPA: hypothetical protein DEB06_08685 [Phycisphaerales bacterium]|nr:hypothetical protein [Phycisphaerales bacterium]
MHQSTRRDTPRPSRFTWLGRMRLRLIIFVIGIPLAAFGAISFGPGWLALPIVGVAVAVVSVSVNKLAQRLAHPVCWTCGHDLSSLTPHDLGVVCPSCGSLNQHSLSNALALALPDDDQDDPGDDADRPSQPA